MRCRLRCAAGDFPLDVTVWRRYSEFEVLRDHLHDCFPGVRGVVCVRRI